MFDFGSFELSAMQWAMLAVTAFLVGIAKARKIFRFLKYSRHNDRFYLSVDRALIYVIILG